MSQGNTTKASEGSTHEILKMSAKSSDSSEMSVDQPITVGRKLLPPIIPGNRPTFVGETQYAAILRLRERRICAKEAREQRLLKAKKYQPRGSNGRFIKTKDHQEGPNGGSTMEWVPALADNYQHFNAINGYKQVTNVDMGAQSSTPTMGFCCSVFVANEGGENVSEFVNGSEAESNIPARIGINCPFITTNEGENVGDVTSGSEVPSSNAPSGFYWRCVMVSGYKENIGEVTSGSMVPIGYPTEYIYWPVVATNEYGEGTGEFGNGSEAPISNPTGDSGWPVVATNEDEENIGEVAYNNILNLESHDPTSLIRVMMGNKYYLDEVSHQFQNVAHLQAPDFTTLLTVMNNAGYDPAADHGPYDVDKVMNRLEGW